MARQGTGRQGMAGRGGPGWVWCVEAGLGPARRSRLCMVSRGGVGSGEAVKVRQFQVGIVVARRSWIGGAGRVKVG
jgi:hypothetical protein